MQSQSQSTVWDFTPVYDLLNSLSHTDNVSSSLFSNSNSTIESRVEREKPDTPQKTDSLGLGNFAQVWDYLGVQHNVPPPTVPSFESSTSLRKPANAYASDGELYYPPSSKNVTWRDETDGGDLVDTAPDSPPHAPLSTKPRHKTKEEKAKKRAERLAIRAKRSSDLQRAHTQEVGKKNAKKQENAKKEQLETQEQENVKTKERVPDSPQTKSEHVQSDHGAHQAMQRISADDRETLHRLSSEGSSSASTGQQQSTGPSSSALNGGVRKKEKKEKKNKKEAAAKVAESAPKHAPMTSPKQSPASTTLRPATLTPVKNSLPTLQAGNVTSQPTTQLRRSPRNHPGSTTPNGPSGAAFTHSSQKPSLGQEAGNLLLSLAQPQTPGMYNSQPNAPPYTAVPQVQFPVIPSIPQTAPVPRFKVRHVIRPLIQQDHASRNWRLLLKLMNNFPSEMDTLLSPLQLSINRPVANGLHVFVDSSNILIGFQEHLKRARNIPIPVRVPAVYPNFHALALLLERRRPVTKRVLAGSTPEVPAFEEAREVGYETCILDKVWKAKEMSEPKRRRAAKAAAGRYASSGYESDSADGSGGRHLQRPKWVEQAVDEVIHLKMLESLVDTTVPVEAAKVAAAGVESANQGAVMGGNTLSTPRNFATSTTPASSSASAAVAAVGSALNNTRNMRSNHTANRKATPVTDAAFAPSTPTKSTPSSSPAGPTMVLATGDAAEAEYSSGFLRMVERALKKGWNVELAAWAANISMEYRKLASKSKYAGQFRIIELNDYAEELFGERSASA